MTTPPIILSATDFDGSRTLAWIRRNPDDLTDPGEWSGDATWVKRARQALLTRSPVRVVEPSVTYEFAPFDGTIRVEEIAAAMVYAVAGRADTDDLFDYLPAALVGDAEEPGPGLIY